MADEEDCWDAFGSSSDEDEDEDTDDGGNNNNNNSNSSSNNNNSSDDVENNNGIHEMDAKAASAIAMHLSQTFVKHNSQVRLSDRIVAVVRVVVADNTKLQTTTTTTTTTNDECNSSNKCMVSKHLEQRQIRVFKQSVSSEQLRQLGSETLLLSTIFGTLDTMVDALIVLENANNSNPITDEKNGDDNISSTTTTTTNSTNGSKWIQELVESILCPGGVLIVSSSSSSSRSANAESMNHTDDDSFTTTTKKDVVEEQLVGGSDATAVLCSVSSSNNSNIHSSSPIHWIARRKKKIRVHASTCPWLSSSHSVVREEERLHLATVALSSHEMASLPFSSSGSTNNNHRQKLPRKSSKLTENSVRKAVTNMKQYGYCVLPGVLDTNECLEWGSTVLDCVHDASKILLERDGVDIYNPHSSHTEPQSYRELSMREDLRMDLRHGPALSKLRARKEGSSKTGGNSILLSASEDHYGDGLFLRGHPGLLEILRRTMNPGSSSSSSSDDALEGGTANSNSNSKSNPLYLGNMGRWNFGGTGNNGTYQDLRISPVGGIVSLPGSADQALHADTPHLFEHLPDLPAHYVNMFAPCTVFENAVGGTAFVHGSHDLAFTSKHYDATNNSSFYPFLVRPRLSLGDVILFDCRILHFGLANVSKSTERCICYVNTWHDWFHDAKNWDKNRAIFDDKDDDDGTKQQEEN
jgi:hypothetical protein